MLRPSGSIVLPFWIKKASLAFRMESRLEKIFSMGINSMSLAVWLGEDRKCSAAVVGLDLLLGLLLGWFGQPKYSTHIKTFLRCTGFCLYFLHFIYVKPVRSPLIQRTPAGSSFRLLAQTFYIVCIVALFANFQNGLIFRILAVFWSRFLHNTAEMWFYSCFSHAFRNFIFWPKLTTLQRL